MASELLPPLPPGFGASVANLQVVAAHVVARARHASTGRFGLRAAPGGFATPAFGADAEVVRVCGPVLVRERSGRAATMPMDGASLADLASFVGVDLSEPFSVGHDTPGLGDRSAPLAIDPAATAGLGQWYWIASAVLDVVVAELGPVADPSAVQLWPEHFDIGCDVAWAPGRGDARVNFGAAPPDSLTDEPYLYVGPWGTERPGPDGYWDAPFGATLSYSSLRDAADPFSAARGFLVEGFGRLKGE
ncbi:MAG: hypothetical protein ACT4PW_10110 [Acidimicrobiia bacterium]